MPARRWSSQAWESRLYRFPPQTSPCDAPSFASITRKDLTPRTPAKPRANGRHSSYWQSCPSTHIPAACVAHLCMIVDYTCVTFEATISGASCVAARRCQPSDRMQATQTHAVRSTPTIRACDHRAPEPFVGARPHHDRLVIPSFLQLCDALVAGTQCASRVVHFELQNSMDTFRHTTQMRASNCVQVVCRRRCLLAAAGSDVCLQIARVG